LTVSKCHFENNEAAGGGAIFHRGKILAVTDSMFSNNIAKEGGAIMFDSTFGPVLVRCAFVNNRANSSYGGAIELYKSEFTTYDFFLALVTHPVMVSMTTARRYAENGIHRPPILALTLAKSLSVLLDCGCQRG
jgi:hypothetical protein